ncbi:MAG: M1 family metallopeptidase [Cyclobacteriaceae bacterium]|nr:M1 family metallopeptidase [Cyclobacteriaceae bacterium]
MKNSFCLSGVLICLLLMGLDALAQNNFERRKFEQLETLLPTPNTYRSADGSPGPHYWQQKADYLIHVELNDDDQSIRGYEEITYHNISPSRLNYLWLQLDQNMMHEGSDTYSTSTNTLSRGLSSRELINIVGHNDDLGYRIIEVKDKQGNALKYTVNKTMMRVDLPTPIESGESYTFSIKWFFYINDRMKVGGRCGFEYFEEDGNYLYTIAQWFPRMCVYDDVEGWQHKQFLGRGEFALPFGDYDVRITVPADHIVASTGELQNPLEVLSSEQISRFEKSKSADVPVIIVSQSEAEEKEKKRQPGKKTWHYKAENVRDFAFGSSRKFIWDAMGVDIGGKKIMAMSYYPKEANPLYDEYSTRVVAHTLKVYSRYTFDYPYPVAISVEAANGMEYPMICFNYGRPDKNGKYSEALKHGMISVIIHEVGHNFFPMIVNSDERQWTWMDEGLNSFMQYLAEQEWDPNYPSRRGPAEKIIPYMKGGKDTMVPVMTNSEQILQFGDNAYGKPATALNILRETIMGRELFDYAFKEYANRWAFKHPTPADFFRTMEDASGVDLDWFWRGWFYTTDHVDIEVSDVTWYKYEAELEAQEGDPGRTGRKRSNSANDQRQVEDASILASSEKLSKYQSIRMGYSDGRITLTPGLNMYEIKFTNHGGLVMPLIIDFEFKDGTVQREKVPAEVWRLNEKEITKVFAFSKELASIILDPDKQTADVDESNNHFPPKPPSSRFDQYKNRNTNY